MIIFAFSAARLSQIVPKSFCRTLLILERTLTGLFTLFLSFTDNPLNQQRKKKVKRFSIKEQWKRDKIVSQTLKVFFHLVFALGECKISNLWWSNAILNGPPKVLLNFILKLTVSRHYLILPCLRDNPFFVYRPFSLSPILTDLSSHSPPRSFEQPLTVRFALQCLTSTVDFYSTYV